VNSSSFSQEKLFFTLSNLLLAISDRLIIEGIYNF